jgi:hypothetical protein
MTKIGNVRILEEEKKGGEYKLFSRVAQYPMVANALNNATYYYGAVKERSALVRYGCEVVESNLEKGKTLVVEPVVNSPLVKQYSEPILSKVDELGCQQLDKIENATFKITDTYYSSKQMLEQKVYTISSDVKSTTSTLFEISKQTLEEKIIPPVDNYLKTSVLSVPINFALNTTESICDTILPGTEKEKKEDEPETGPVIRAGKLGQKVQQRAIAKIKGISLRSPENIKNFKFTVDLIHYAATQIDNSAKLAQQFVDASVHKSFEVAHSAKSVIYEKNMKSVNEVKDLLNSLSVDALTSLHTALESLSQHLPTSITSVSKNAYESLKEKTKSISGRLDSVKDLVQFSVLAKKSAEKLHEASTLISSFFQDIVTKSESVLPDSVFSSFSFVIESALDILGSIFPSEKIKQFKVEEKVYENRKEEKPTEVPKEEESEESEEEFAEQ